MLDMRVHVCSCYTCMFIGKFILPDREIWDAIYTLIYTYSLERMLLRCMSETIQQANACDIGAPCDMWGWFSTGRASKGEARNKVVKLKQN